MSGFIDHVAISYDEDGMFLELDGDFEEEDDDNVTIFFDTLTAKLSPTVAEQLDKALQPFRDHQAEGLLVRAEFEAHKASGRCTGWEPGGGPCTLEPGHDGECFHDGMGK